MAGWGIYKIKALWRKQQWKVKGGGGGGGSVWH